MLDRYQQYVPALIYVAAAAFLLGYSFEIGRATAHQQERKQIGATNAPNNPVNKDKGGEVSLLGVRVGEGLLVVVTLMLVGATYQLVTSSKQSSERQLRSYVSVEPDRIDPYEGQSYLIGHFKIRNSGQIPAKNVSTFSTIDRDQNGARFDFPLRAVTKTKIALQPRTEMRFGTGKWDVPAVEKIRDRRIELDGYLYVWGEVTYTDSFGTQGRTKFCHRYPCEMFGKDGAGPHSISAKHARYHEPVGNEAA